MTANEIIETLNLAPHPEGGWYRQTWEAGDGPRASGTCIYFLLKAGECITFDNHRIVHGRAAYSATSGDRYLRGTYTDRAEMRSRLEAFDQLWKRDLGVIDAGASYDDTYDWGPASSPIIRVSRTADMPAMKLSRSGM